MNSENQVLDQVGIQQVDRHSLKIIYSGCFWGFFSLVGLATIEIPTWYT